MSDQKLIENITLVTSVLSGVLLVYLVGGFSAVLLVALAVHLVVERIEDRAPAIPVRHDEDDKL